MSTVREVYQYLNEIAPFALQESYDNAGLIVGNADSEVTGVLLCLDSTEAIVEEAISLNCNLIIAHHPIIFGGLKRLVGDNYIQRTVMQAIKHDVSIIAIHTNLDNVLSNGVNGMIAEKIGLKDIVPLKPLAQDMIDTATGAGVLGTLDNAMSTEDFFDLLKSSMDLKVIKHTAICHEEITKVAVCGGSGGFLLNHAKAAGAQVFVTSDYKYHEYFDADGDIIIADIGHYESEQYTIQLLYRLINQKFSTFAPHCTKHITNPVNYY